MRTEEEFIDMVNDYKAKGIRMVCFERECEGGWVMAFDTGGVSAEELPKSAFDVPEVEPWCRFNGWDSVLDDDVRIFDDTDDPQFLIDSYDYTANFPVLQINR